ncbi:MAG: hypothetical protein IJK93_06105 [Muribaculaceae bacterium]|nr:hypothetical protein [Muribaculaceae bacterium]
MKKIFFTLTAVFAIGLVALTSSCGNSATNEKTESTEEQVEAEAPADPTTVTTSKGTYDFKMVMKRMYKDGFSKGKSQKSIYDKAPDKNPKSKLLQLAEVSFKEDWKIYYGEPNNEEAKAVYEKALEKYLQGWEEGLGVHSTTIDSIQ